MIVKLLLYILLIVFIIASTLYMAIKVSLSRNKMHKTVGYILFILIWGLITFFTSYNTSIKTRGTTPSERARMRL